MTAPLYEFGAFGDVTSLAVAIALGIAFGVFLERGGMGDARKLAAQFTGRDFAVAELMGTAVLTAMVGLLVGSALGWIDLRLLYVPPTVLPAQIVGGLIFGAGFAASGLCPGTCVVAAASGRADGLAALVGVVLGIGGFSAAYPLVAPLHGDGGERTATWAGPFGGGRGVIELSREFASGAGVIAAVDLAEAIIDGPAPQIVDLRGVEAFDAFRIPTSERLAFSAVARRDAGPRELVLVDDGRGQAARAWLLLRRRGHEHVRVLRGGAARWATDVLEPVLPRGTPDERAHFDRVARISRAFGGLPIVGERPVDDDTAAAALRMVQRRGCR